MATFYLQLEVSTNLSTTPGFLGEGIRKTFERNGISVDKIHASQTPPPDPEPLIHALMQALKHIRGDKDALPYPELAQVVDGAMAVAVEVRA